MAVVLMDARLRPDVRQHVLEELAQEVEQLGRPDAPGAVLVVRRLDAQSRDLTAQLMDCDIAAIGLAPQAPVPPRKEDVAKELGAWSAAVNGYNRALAGYEPALSAYRARLARVQGQASACADGLRHVTVPASRVSQVWEGIDVGAGDLRQQPDADRHLIIVGDAEEVPDLGPNEPGWTGNPTLLTGVRVTFAGFTCESARRCDARQDAWRFWLTQAGAATITFHDASESLRGVFDAAGSSR